MFLRANPAPSEEHRYFDGNAVSTSKYTVLSFIPKTLWEFFSVVANVYFMVVSLLQVRPLTPARRPLERTPSPARPARCRCSRP